MKSRKSSLNQKLVLPTHRLASSRQQQRRLLAAEGGRLGSQPDFSINLKTQNGIVSLKHLLFLVFDKMELLGGGSPVPR